MHRRSIVLLAAASLAGCARPAPQPEPTAIADTATPAPQAASPGPTRSPGFSLAERFTALGTEPFWAAKVAGDRLTYQTPEDQAGRTIAVSRRSGADFVELDGTLGEARLILRVTSGPCSDGMSDTVYPLSVVRQLGDDEQRGCARSD